MWVLLNILKANMLDAADPMEKSFAGLMYCAAMGDPIDMSETLKKFPVKLTSVSEYAEHQFEIVH